MGLIPATGTAIAMGKVARAYGLGGASPLAAGRALGMRVTLGAYRSISTGAVPLSSTFGGQTTGSAYPTGSVGTY